LKLPLLLVLKKLLLKSSVSLMEQFEVAVEEVKEDLAAKVDDYLN
jgi:hypothetical protein